MSKHLDPFRPAERTTDCPECGYEIAWNREDGLTGQLCLCGYIFSGRERNPKRTVEYDDKTYKVRSDRTEIPDFTAMTRIAVLSWLCRETYPQGTNHRRPNPLAGMGDAISLTVR